MAIESVAGGEPTETNGTNPAPQSGSAAPPPPGEPYAVIDGQEFASPEALSDYWNSTHGGGPQETTVSADTNTATVDAGSGNDSITGNDSISTSETDTLKGGQGNDAITRTDDEIRADLKKAGGIYADERYEPFALEFEKTGDLSAESVKKAAEVFAIPEDFVKSFVDAQKTARTAQSQVAAQPSPEMIATATVINEVIPQEADYRALMKWGHEGGLTAEQQQAYDKALDANDKTTVKVLLTSFKAAFDASGHGGHPRDVTSEGTGSSGQGGITGYASSAEMQADMGKPEYETDAAFRAKVQARVAASKF